MIDDEELQPGEYDHTYENVAEEEVPDRGNSLRVVVWIVSAVIAVVMVAFPVIQVIDWGDDDNDANASASDARAVVASRFAESALARLSANDAARWALPNLRDEIEAIVGDLRRRPVAELQGATISLARVDCNAPTDDDSECFHAWARQPGAADLIRVKLTVSIVNGNARVIEIERVNVV